MQMNHFIYQNQSVYCDCLAASPHNNPQGLKPSRMQASPFDPNIYHRVTKSTEGKSGEFSRTRTSLRQQKPQTPTPSTQSLLTCVPSHGHLGKIRPLTVDYVAKLPAQPWSANEQPTQSVRPRTNCMPAPGVYYADQPQKRITVIRNTFVNEEGPRFQYRLDEYALKEQNKRAARIKYGAAEGQRFHVGEQLEKRAPMAATLNTERTNRKHSVLFSSSQQHKINLRVSNYSKKSSLRGSAKQQQNPQAPLHQPFKMILKQIESVMDENQNLSEQLSFVIGRGWDDEDKDFKEDRLRTETHATMASNIRNSSMMGSHLFTAQSNVMK